MKMIIVTDDQGNILGAVQGHSLSDKQGDIEANVSFADGHLTHLVEVDEDMDTIENVEEFQKRLMQHLQRHLQSQHGAP